MEASLKTSPYMTCGYFFTFLFKIIEITLPRIQACVTRERNLQTQMYQGKMFTIITLWLIQDHLGFITYLPCKLVWVFQTAQGQVQKNLISL